MDILIEKGNFRFILITNGCKDAYEDRIVNNRYIIVN